MHYKNITVKEINDIRLDRYLKKIYPTITQGIIEKNLRTGKIRLNEKKATSNLRINIGDVLNVTPLLHSQYQDFPDANVEFEPNVISLAGKMLSEYLLYSSDDLIIIDKPNNLAVQGGSKINLSVDHALEYLKNIHNIDYKLVHRLDKATSGILLIAKNYDAARKITEGFTNKIIKKTYIAVLMATPKKREGIISNKIEKISTRDGEKVVVTDSGKLAETKYKTLGRDEEYSLVEFSPLTGRMHQLRVHSQVLGCPILGDIKYGGPKYKRMMLHAHQVFLPKSILGYEVSIESTLPEAFSELFS